MKNSDCLIKQDASLLALRNIHEFNDSLAQEVIIYPDSVQKYYFALVHIYLTENLLERDTVVTIFDIHTFATLSINEIALSADSNSLWVDNWLNGEIYTGIT